LIASTEKFKNTFVYEVVNNQTASIKKERSNSKMLIPTICFLHFLAIFGTFIVLT
jgi:hypothetical protein